MKYMKYGMLTVALLGMAQIASADALLIDAYGGAPNPTTYSNWVSAGVTEDISDGAAGTIVVEGATYNIDGGMTVTENVGKNNKYSSSQFGNDMLDGYWYAASGTVSLGGLNNELTSTMEGDMLGNTFQIQANQDYKLYLFGVGADGTENATFTFNGESKTTASLAQGTGEDSRYVAFEFTTGADVSDYTLDFTFEVDQGSTNGAFNGLALVAIPEPATLGMVASFGIGVLFIRRRLMM